MSCRMVSLLVLAVALFPLMCGSAVSPVATASLRQTEIARVVPRELFLRLRGGGACLGLPSRWGEMDELLLNEHLGQAAANGKIERVIHLVDDLDANVNSAEESGQTPLLRASEQGHTAMVKLLLSFGANLTHVDHRGSSALHYAAYNGHTATVEVLVKAGISPNSVNKFGYSALQYAAADGRAETTSRLVELGADVNQRDKMRWTAMHRAAGNGHSDVVKILVAAGCAPNAADSQNYTALHEAVWCGHLGSCQALLEAGADPFCADLYGNTPIDLATAQARKGRADLLELLTSAKDRSDGDGVERKVASESTGSAGGGSRRASDG